MNIEHIALYVKDLEKSRNFYIKYFKAVCGEKYHNPKTGFQSYFLTFDGGTRLELMSIDNLPQCKNDTPRLGYMHIAFCAGSRSAVDDLTQRLEKDGFKVISQPRTTGDGYYESCVLDYDDNMIEITV